MKQCDFSMTSARDEMRRVVGCSTPDVIVGSNEAQAAHKRYFIHEQASVEKPRVKCVMKIMAMPGVRTTEAGLCIFGLAERGQRGPGFVNARQVGMRMQRKRRSRHRHAAVDANDMRGEVQQTGTWVNRVVSS